MVPFFESSVCTIDVRSVDEFVAKIKKAGGKQVTKKDTIPGVGDFCYCMDNGGKPVRDPPAHNGIERESSKLKVTALSAISKFEKSRPHRPHVRRLGPMRRVP